MTRSSYSIGDIFDSQPYGLRGEVTPREWHTECNSVYQSSVTAWVSRDVVASGKDQHCFCIAAGTGSGKTQAAGHLASFLLNRKFVDQVVLVCPNRSIRRRAIRVFRELFGIHLAVFHARRHIDGIPRTQEGYILTYSHLIQDPTLHRRICSRDTLVIFDEIHHLGDESGWGDAAIEAFGRVNFILALSGTPFRSDNRMIPFVVYEPVDEGGLMRFVARPPVGFSYPLGRAIVEGVCRKPLFQFHDATVELRMTPDSDVLTVSFKDKVPDKVSSLRLRHAVRYGSVARSKMLREALDRCREEGRKVVVFLGGDTEGEITPTADATEFLPSELREMGITDDEFEVVTGEDETAQEKIEKFGASNKWILISINMVSEGTDIPELSAAILLTSITAKQTTLQRIGRILRLMGPDDPFKAALVFAFEDPDLLELADEIEDEIRREVRFAADRPKPQSSEVDSSVDRPVRAEGNCVDGGNPTVVKFGSSTYPASIVEEARLRCKDRHLPMTMLQAVLSIIVSQNDGNG